MIATRHLAIGLAVAAMLAAGTAAVLQRPTPAPDVPYTALDGTRSRLTDLRGKVVLVNFWATSCAVCVAEMPDLVALHRRHHGPAFETLSVAMAYDPPARVVRFAEAHALPFTVAIDNLGEIARGFGDVAATPTTLLVDKRGRIVHRIVGRPDFEALDALVRELVAEG